MAPLVVDPCSYLNPHHSVGHCHAKPSEPSNGASQTASGPTSNTTPPSLNSPHP